MFDILLRILRSQLYSELYSSFFVLFLWALFSLFWLIMGRSLTLDFVDFYTVKHILIIQRPQCIKYCSPYSKYEAIQTFITF